MLSFIVTKLEDKILAKISITKNFQKVIWVLKNGHKKYVHFLKTENTFEKDPCTRGL